MIAHEQLAEVQGTDSAAEQPEAATTLIDQVETATGWREALLARVHPADHRISDEDIFAILNDESEGLTAAELCARSGVTVPMYCVWKSKYRQLSLEELRQARRREQRRRYSIIGLAVLVATLSAGAIVVGLSWAMLSAITGSTASPPVIAATPSQVEPAQLAARVEPRQELARVGPAIVEQPLPKRLTIDPQPQPAAEAPIEEAGYRIQVTAADTEQQGLAMVAKLESAGYPAYMMRAVVGDKNVFRVRVGPFETQPEAEKIAADLRTAGYKGVWIAR